MIDPDLLLKAVKASGDGIVISDARRADNPLIYVNPAFEKMTGYEAREVLDQNCRFLQGEDRDQPGLQILRTALRNGEPCVVQLRNYRKDGSMFWNELSISPVHDAGGRLTHYIGVQKDITRRVEAQELLEEKQAELERANLQLTELAIRDGLTGIYNRRHFDDQLEEEWRRAVRRNSTVSLLMIDIDAFKQFNDTYGHKAGDDCLRQVAAAIRDRFQRGGEVVARYGGEEFVVLAPEIDREEGLSCAERLRLEIHQLRIEHTGSAVDAYLTVSIGLATDLPAPGSDPYGLVDRADMALYRAKAEGRNRVVTAR